LPSLSSEVGKRGGTSNASPAATFCTFHNWYCMKFKSLLLFLLLLLVFCGHSYATKPREAGIGIKYGYTTDGTSFQGTADTTQYIDRDTSEKINNRGTTQIPVFVQLDEELLGDSSFTYWFFDITRLIQKDHPPALRGGTYTDLVEAKNYEVPTANTYTAAFANFYPQYSSIIDNASNPSLSADYYVTKITFGKTWGIFYASSERHRWMSFGLGIGINYIEGSYSINVCDPYLLSSEVSSKVSPNGDFREGICKKKTELYAAKINHFSWELNMPLKLYSYIGDTFEFNFGEVDFLLSTPSHYLKHENALEPNFSYQANNIISTVVHF